MVDTGKSVVVRETGEIMSAEDAGQNWALTIVEIKRRVLAVTQLFKEVMIAKTDFDTIPGTPKPTLLQPGAQLLDNLISASPTFELLPDSIQDWDRGLFYFHYRCRLIHKSSGAVLGEGEGSCNSREPKYRWRYSKPVCPVCEAEAIAQSKYPDRNTGKIGFYCNKKAGGCGAAFGPDDERITSQKAGRVENTEPFEVVNTLQKMGQKRAHVAATLNATGASRIFTQDVEDLTPPTRSASSELQVVEGEVVEPEPEPTPDSARAPDEATLKAKYQAKWNAYWREVQQLVADNRAKLDEFPTLKIGPETTSAQIAEKGKELAGKLAEVKERAF